VKKFVTCTLLMGILVSGLAFGARESLDPREMANEEACARIIKTMQMNPGLLIDPSNQALSMCSRAQVAQFCQEAKARLEKNPRNQMPACQGGVQIAAGGPDHKRIIVVMPGGGSGVYNSCCTTSTHDHNFDVLKSRGFQPRWDRLN
jgi:hypothetical protein